MQAGTGIAASRSAAHEQLQKHFPHKDDMPIPVHAIERSYEMAGDMGM